MQILLVRSTYDRARSYSTTSCSRAAGVHIKELESTRQHAIFEYYYIQEQSNVDSLQIRYALLTDCTKMDKLYV